MSQVKKVFVGVSGGVDSSVSLALLQKAGYDVTGVFLKVWNPAWLPCNWKEERRSAMRVCATLGVPFLTIDLEKEYKEEVVDYMVREYSLGRVPNPDVFCNKYIKFGAFLKRAKEMGADFIATGHYAQIRKVGGVFELQESVDQEKDQSYFLYTLTQAELSHTFFPVGGMKKSEVRDLARKFRLPTAEKKDSQGLCFIGKVDMKDFLKHYIKTKEGNVLNVKGEVVGKHAGALLFAIGERHGFTISKKTPEDPRYFVIAKNLNENTITVANKEKEVESVFSAKSILIKELNIISGVHTLPEIISVRIRYRQDKQECSIKKTHEGWAIIFMARQSAISVGQSAVLYDADICLGGGIIEAVR